MYQNYTFSYQGPKNMKRYLYCSRKNRRKCAARLKLDDYGNIVQAFIEHNHPPAQYSKTSSGFYVKIFDG